MTLMCDAVASALELVLQRTCHRLGVPHALNLVDWSVIPCKDPEVGILHVVLVDRDAGY